MLVFTDSFIESNGEKHLNVRMESSKEEILVVVGMRNQESVEWIQSNSQKSENIICFVSSPGLANKLGGAFVESQSDGKFLGKISRISQLKKSDETVEVVKTVSEAWERHNSNDIRKALQCLNKCSPVDQACNYWCIASYKSPNLEALSLRVLQKNNCLELDAKIPEKPYHGEISRQRLMPSCRGCIHWVVGVFGLELAIRGRAKPGFRPVSLSIPALGKRSFRYESLFQVKTLEGEMVWRRRRYRVKKGKVPGTFYFSVLDNGVISNEFWTIVDAPDDLRWSLFRVCFTIVGLLELLGNLIQGQRL